jgi:hypothetical protein
MQDRPGLNWLALQGKLRPVGYELKRVVQRNRDGSRKGKTGWLIEWEGKAARNVLFYFMF